jgi:hypothetical protein
MQKGLQKQAEALEKYRKQKEAFFITRKQILLDLEDARRIWRKTLEQMPGREFS